VRLLASSNSAAQQRERISEAANVPFASAAASTRKTRPPAIFSIMIVPYAFPQMLRDSTPSGAGEVFRLIHLMPALSDFSDANRARAFF
jgi:hypothetical protein